MITNQSAFFPWHNKAWIRLLVFALCYCAVAAIAAPAQQYFNLLQTFNGTNGSTVSSPLIQGTNGNLYGTTYAGGSSCTSTSGPGGLGCGTVFQVTPANVMTTLYVFCSLPSCADGQNPYGAIVEADGNIYGTTLGGGANNAGTVYQLTPEGVLTTLYSFSGDLSTDYGGPGGLLLGSDGNLYGTTNSNQSAQGLPYGTLFQITPSGTFTTLWNYRSNPTQVAAPIGTLAEDSSGNFWGAGTFPTCGGVLEFSGGTMSTAFQFSRPENQGCTPTSIMVGADGNVYGTTKFGGQSGNPGSPCYQGLAGCGTIFSVAGEQSGFAALYSFCTQAGCPDGAYPLGTLAQGANGNLYGITTSGGANTNANCAVLFIANIAGCGTVFEITTSATLTTLYSFCTLTNCADGYNPTAGLLQANTGTFYGAAGTSYNATNTSCPGCTLFSLSSFSGNVSISPGSLSFGSVGLYETSLPKNVTLTNSGSGTLYIGSILPSANFAISSSTCGATLAPNAKCTVSVTFTPNQLGTFTGDLAFTDSGPYSPQEMALIGKGIAPVTLMPASSNFGKHKVGTTSNPKTFTLKNPGSSTLSNINISVTGPFAVASTTCGSTLNGNSTCTISVTFSPTQTGAASGVLAVSDSSINSPQISGLSGTGD